MIALINCMLSNRRLQVTFDDKRSSVRKLNNGLLQGSVLAPLLFNVYISDLPKTISRKFAYADDLALATQNKNMDILGATLTQDLKLLSIYFKNWRLTPSTTKTESSCFHLNNRMANSAINVTLNGVTLPYNPQPKYLGTTLDRTLTFRTHLTKLASKLRTRNNILHKLAASSWGATADTLRTTALSLVFSTAEYCAAVWLNSPHTKKIDTVLNDSLRIITGCIKPTPLYWLPALSNIEPPTVRRHRALMRTFSMINANQELPIHTDLKSKFGRLKSRHPPIILARNTTEDPKVTWKKLWLNQAPPEYHQILDSAPPSGFHLPRSTWVSLNRIRTGNGRSGDSLHKWGMRESPSCDCGEARQTVKHITFECPLRKFQGNTMDLVKVSTEAVKWITNLDITL